MTDHTDAAACAAEIVALINSKSTSPTQQEIEALLGRIFASGHCKPAPDVRPRMPQLTDKDLDDLYAYAGDAETAGRTMLHMLNSLFYDYRLAAHGWDHARGLLSPEQLDGADAEKESRREQTRGQMARVEASADTAGWQLKTNIEQLWSGLTTMDVLINSRRRKDGSLDLDTTISLAFCVQSMTQLSERVDELLETAEVRCKPEPSTEASASS